MEREKILERLFWVIDELLKVGRVEEAQRLLEKFKKVDWTLDKPLGLDYIGNTGLRLSGNI